MGANRRRRNRSAARSKARAPVSPDGRHAPDRVLWGTVFIVLLLLAALGDDRHVGLIADGRQMIRTAVAITETGEIGQSQGRDFTLDRPGGDAVSRFGMGMSLLQVPAAAVAPAVEKSLGIGSSEALFLIVPWLAVGAAAAAAGSIVRGLHGNDAQVACAVLLASVASPLGSYAQLEFSEPVQAAALGTALAAAFGAARTPARRHPLEFMAGAAAGFAVLTKSSLILAAPFTLLPLADSTDRTRSRQALTLAALGAAGPLVTWASFEFLRFGRVFGGYPDDPFTHPWLDGIWRLTVGPNRGLLLFWPGLALFALAAVRWRGVWLSSAAARTWSGATLVLTAQIAVAAGYWGWHGMEGWGPRLIIAAIPLLAPFAATAHVPRPAMLFVVLVSVVINAPPLLQHPTPVATYVTNLAWPEIPQSDRNRFPFYAMSETSTGRPTVVPFEPLELEPAANPWRVYSWFWRSSMLDDDRLAKRLTDPPWKLRQPHLVPAIEWPPEVARRIAPRPRLGFLGRSLTGTGGPYAHVYAEALLDQVIRANQQGRIPRALELSDRRLALGVDGEAAAWRLESLRRAGRAAEAEAFLRSLPESSRVHPLINVALALFDRDFGEEQRARALLGSVAEHFPGTPLREMLTAPLASWPATLHAMTRAPRRDASIVRPRM